jgi:membrane-bound lytic murein transglycosylase D
MAYDTIMASGFVNLKILATNLNICYEDLKTLNPGFKRYGLRSDNKLYPIKLPADRLELFQNNKDSILTIAAQSGKKELEHLARNSVGSTYGRDKIVYRVRSGDVLGIIAQRYHVRVSDIRRWNRLSSNVIRVGQNLNIWIYPGSAPVASRKNVPETVSKSFFDASGRKVYIVQPGDTLWDIARKNKGLDIDKIKLLNNLKSSSIKPGQKLIIG